ncbi:MAG: hypothetical protein FJW30_18665 [Acidobacteria bacterium]|nr:hypothetical protein [Acidobacteriota bacterium]
METTVEPRAQKRLAVVAWLTLIWGGILVARLIQFQVVEHDALKAQAQRQQEHVVEIQAPRGAILSGGEGGGPLALSVPVRRIIMNPLRIPEGAEPFAVEMLHQLLGSDAAALTGAIAEARKNRRGYLLVSEDATEEQIKRLRSSKLDIFTFERGHKREYPKGKLAAHLIGWVNFEGRGDAGLERALQDELQGVAGRMRMMKDARGRDYDGEVINEEKPEPGVSVTITIDEAIQHAAEDALRRAVEKERVPSGTVVVLNPKTGDILAMASYPVFDPRDKVHSEADMMRRVNLAVAGAFEPGSVSKAVTAAAALETTRYRPESTVLCGNGLIRLAGRVIHDHDPYSALSMTMVLAKSSNIGAINLGLAAGNDNMYEYLGRFGIGERVGLGLPGESPGVVYPVREWTPSSMGSVAMGHEFMATPMHLAQAFAIIANNGALVRPRIVKARQRPGGEKQWIPLAPPEQRIKPETAIDLRRMLEQTVLAGTGKGARVKGYTVGGKTGTAQIPDPNTGKYLHRYNSSFVGFAPVADPAIVVSVTLNGSYKYGGENSAPVFAEVAAAALRTLGVKKDLPDEDQPAKPESAEPPAQAPLQVAETKPEPMPETPIANGQRVPDFSGMTLRRVMEKSMSEGWNVQPVGQGLARAQEPPAGTLVPPAHRIRVVFRR